MLTQSSHMLAGADRLEAHEGDLHTGKSSNGVPRGVSNVESVGETTHADKHERVQRDHIGDEDVSTCGASYKYQMSAI